MNIKEIDQLLNDSNEHINKLNKIVKKTIKEEKLILNNLLNEPKETLPLDKEFLTK